jgi:hypothetical protein
MFCPGWKAMVTPEGRCNTPWCVGSDPNAVPEYQHDLHDGLACTIRSGLDSMPGRPDAVHALNVA